MGGLTDKKVTQRPLIDALIRSRQGFLGAGYRRGRIRVGGVKWDGWRVYKKVEAKSIKSRLGRSVMGGYGRLWEVSGVKEEWLW